MKNDSEIGTCIRKAVESYFKDLDGEKPCELYDLVIRCVEKPLIEIALNHSGGNQTRAAELLGLNRNTLRKKMQDLGIS
ncbi:MAG TPA: helix-turn-helix domain-containing protein [Burkholderiales bacterium]|nr:helix-turn-helix domain-containing protein [Burkholderiales bacterium]